jgi:NADH-quinone oxidoreductase subunit M
MTGPTRPDAVVTGDLDRREIGVVAPLLVGLVVFGFFPGPIVSVINPTVDSILNQVGVSQQAPVVPAAEEGQQ